MKWAVWWYNRWAYMIAHNAAVAAEWAADDAELAAKVSRRMAGGLTRRRRGRRGAGSGRRRQRQQQRERQRSKQIQQQQVRAQEQQRRVEEQWRIRQQEKWQGRQQGSKWWLVRRRTPKATGRATRARGTAAPVLAEAPVRHRRAVRARLAQLSRGMRGVSHAWGMRLGGGGKRGWVT